MKPIGVIGGSGLYEMLDNAKMFIYDNKFGRSSEISGVFQKHLKNGVEDFIRIISLCAEELSGERDCPCSRPLGHAILAK